MHSAIRKTTMTVGALGALALGGSALANAATSSNTATANNAATAYGQAPSGQRPDPTKPGGHVGANGQTEQALSAADAAKVKAAALAKVPGATVLRVETNVDGGGPYEAHITKSDGSQAVVLFDASYNAVSVQAMGHP
jgi:uncharacterized membrane protein YkoI